MDTTSQTTHRPSRSLRVVGTVSAAAAAALVGVAAAPSPAVADGIGHPTSAHHRRTFADPAALPAWGATGAASTYLFGGTDASSLRRTGPV